jgi:glycine cleavage system H protein
MQGNIDPADCFATGGEEMSEVPAGLYYTTEHEWIKVNDSIATIGITDHAQNALTDIVYVELPEVGDECTSMDEFASIESVKSVSAIYVPLDGVITDVNIQLEDAPELINEDPYGTGWIAKIQLADSDLVSELLSAEAYRILIDE